MWWVFLSKASAAVGIREPVDSGYILLPKLYSAAPPRHGAADGGPGSWPPAYGTAGAERRPYNRARGAAEGPQRPRGPS